jgi:uncharacterized protein
MLKNLCGFVVVSLALACAAPAFADPSVQDIYNAADAGHLGEAQQMLEEVLKDHPHSARAHWMAAEMYARGSNFDRARQELQTAEQIAPGLPFVRPDAVARLQQQLGQGSAAQQRAAAPAAPHYAVQHVHPAFPLRTVLFVIGAIIVLWLILRPRTPAAAYSQYPGGMATGPMVGGGSGLGSGIAGGLASGLAVGAGVVAGEELAHHFLDGNRTEGGVAPTNDPSVVPDNSDMGGQNFGIDDTSTWGDDSGGGDMSGGGGDWST